ncbi:neutral zinc metallopeptidase [Amycolatopsis sp. FDAARGOS 1241]|uniref:neutral zinc metallopeptidase n=1 Tax=Amycolatopsis sp. FDAARGOS 1241 TaxID=2778070 RepID=UPI001951CC75|nr:neutral zinc metallopeptidase [Amycolatopsis sp. FDAARGOS 1241]QRP46891.1 neutral zinc metallopeptidase [Amycolatopsis sp. FDAARGOS 1241]
MTSRFTWVATLIAGAVLLAGCTTAVQGSAGVEKLDPEKVAGLAITDGPSGPKQGVADAGLPVANTDGGAIDKLAANAVADVQQYWTEQLPENFGKDYKPVGQLISYDSRGPGLNICGSTTAGLVNAFYCPSGDLVAWDRGELLPMLNDSFGPMSVVAVLAHELGHAVQTRLGLSPNTPSIVKEQQADCYAGTFFRWVAEGNSPHFQVSTGSGLNQIMATLFFIRDSAGSSFDTAGAHGSAFDRVSAFQFGFTDGPKRCAAIDNAEVVSRTSQLPFSQKDLSTGDGKGNLDVDDSSNLQDLETSLRAAFPGSSPQLTSDAVSCSDARSTSPAAYCPASNTVSVDLSALRRIGTPPTRGNTGGLGDFAAFAEVASRYALSVEKDSGLRLDVPSTGQLTACLTGMWAGTLTPDKKGALELSPGDLDEAIAELLSPKSVIASDASGTAVPSGFARVEAFRAGFTSPNVATCTSKYTG